MDGKPQEGQRVTWAAVDDDIVRSVHPPGSDTGTIFHIYANGQLVSVDFDKAGVINTVHVDHVERA